MNKTAYVVEDSEIKNVIVVDENTDLALFGATSAPSIPENAGNGWKLIGGKWTAPEPEPAEPAPLAPLTARQLRLGLLKIGIKPADVAAAIAALPAEQRDAAAIEWDYASEYRRDHPLIAQLGATFGLSSEQIDDAWREAMAL